MNETLQSPTQKLSIVKDIAAIEDEAFTHFFSFEKKFKTLIFWQRLEIIQFKVKF